MRNTSGGRIVGGLTGLAVLISKNDGALAPPIGTFAEAPASSGLVSFDLLLADMLMGSTPVNKVVAIVSATGANDAVLVITPTNMIVPRGRVWRLDHMIGQIWRRYANKVTDDGTNFTIYQDDNVTVMLQGPIGTGPSSKGQMF